MANMASSVAPFPLRKFTESQFQQLGHVLWSWPLCVNCQNSNRCGGEDCPSRRSKRLGRFLEYYNELTAFYEPDLKPGEVPAIRTHEDIFEIIKKLKSDPDVTRGELASKLAGNRVLPPAADQERAINLAVRLMVMVNCSAQHQPSSVLEHGPSQVLWRDGVTFSQFISDIFPMTDHPGINDEDPTSSLSIKLALTARKLKKRAGLRFRPTDDLRSHLKLDPKSHVVEIYHHTAFLKEHLRLTKDQPRNMSVSDSLRIGAIPRQLALEILDSIQKILFPLSDPKSRSLLLSLTSTASFDPDSLRFESASIRAADEKDIAYLYLGNRLADLYEELENPKPRGWVEKWLERKSRARHVMMATIAGVALALFLGTAGLAVAIYQAWVGYQAWQHPVGNG